MNIYVDLGAYDGNTADCKKLFNFDADYKIGFEPNPLFSERLQDLFDEFYPSAVWIEDGEMEFSVDISDTPLGSTLMQSKAQWKSGRHIIVETVDFSKYVEELSPTELLVKMDIEGAEFELLEKMLRENTIDKVTRLYCEFHPNKVKEYTTRYKNDLLNRLQKRTEVHEWLD